MNTEKLTHEHLVGVIALVAGHDGPKNPRVLLGKCHSGLLPAATLTQPLHPLRDGVVVVLASQHDSLGPLYQQTSPVIAAALGDAAQTGLAAAGILSGCQSQPGAELCTILELFEVTDRGHDG